ncbi:MAG TPA: solute carrier family 23 protein [Pseudonocardiaceae bacterium]|nr:solute carrier family 23 protein [Pseudonocardiaceae bacterium]
MSLWTVHGDGRSLADGEVVRPDERLSWPMTIGFGLQHLVAMFGATVLVPALTGFPISATLLFSGIGTLLFIALTRNRVPAYLGSSFAFVAPLVAAKSQGVPAALGGVLIAGVLLFVVGVAVKALGIRLVDSVMPPVVTGTVIVLITLNQAPTAAVAAGRQALFAALTITVAALCAILSKGLLARLSVLIGVVVGWVASAAAGVLDPGALIALDNASWFGLPTLQHPELRGSAVVLMLPAVFVLVAQNVAHMKAIGAVTGRDLDGHTGDVLIATGLATALAGAGGGSASSTYAENIGVMVATRVYSTAAYLVAALGAIALSLCPKVSALVATIPPGVTGGATLMLYGLVTLVGIRIWLDNKVDLTDPLNLLVPGAAIAVGIGNVTVDVGPMQVGGIVWGSVVIVIGYPLLRRLRALRG